MDIDKLTPRNLWQSFSKISKIPHESRNEQQLVDFIRQLAATNGAQHVSDQAGNLLVRLPGNLDKPTLILQSHLDMVCEKNDSSSHNFYTDPLELIVDGEWMRANGTTLGADNGIGVAAMLSLIEDPAIPHPPLELLFTIDEETGLNGACGLDPAILSGRTLLNLDSEDDGKFCIGCAGGLDTRLSLELDRQERITDACRTITISGLQGGHSGTDIDAGLANAIKLLARTLMALPQPFRLIALAGGTKHNAIPRTASATISGDEPLEPLLEQLQQQFRAEFPNDPLITLSCSQTCGGRPLSEQQSATIIRLLNELPHGVTGRTEILERDMVATSTNLAICSMEESLLQITTSQRSFDRDSIEALNREIIRIADAAGAQSRSGQGYPGWLPQPDSAIIRRSIQAYRELRGHDPEIEVIHAGLECGVIGSKIPDLEMISFGPTIMNPHSPSERVHIPAVKNFWELLLAILKSC